MTRSLIARVALLSSAASAAFIGSAAAQEAPAPDPATNVEDVIVTGYADRQLLLDVQTPTGSRLNLGVREVPAIVDILSQRQIQELGARTSVEALNRAPGVTSSNLGTGPGQLSLRGFTGGSVALLYDGVRSATPVIFTRSLDSWAFDRIEILKGPASVLYGEGALAGAVNLVPKRPVLGSAAFSGLASYGSFDATRAALDVNLPLGDTLAGRIVSSHSRSDGYIDDTESEFFATTASLRWAPTDRLTVDLAADYYEDAYETAYLGTPLVPRSVARNPSDIVSTANDFVIDEAMRDVNFNVTDAVLDSDTLWLRSRVVWTLNDAWTFSNELNTYRSNRNFVNAEIFTFAPATGLIDRSTGIVTHDLDFWVERAALAHDGQIGGMRNRFSIGAEYSELDFFTRRRFGSTTSVDAYQPVRGTFPVGDTAAIFPSRADNDNQVDTLSLFAEDALNLTERLLLVGGVRWDRIDLDRASLNPNNGITTDVVRDYDVVSGRIGMVYDLRPKTQLFAQYSSAVVPVANILSLSLANAQFDLTTGQSIEGGIKSSFWNDRIDATLAAYRIEQDDIITRSPTDPTLSVQGGSQSSQGVELSLSAAVTSQLRIDGNYTVLDSRFDELIEAGGVSREGNTPPRAPERIANLFAFYTLPNAPLTVNAGIRHAGRFFTDNANTIRVDGYTTLDAGVTWRLPQGDLSLRGRNLTDEFYGDYTDVSATQITLAAPRSFDITFTASF